MRKEKKIQWQATPVVKEGLCECPIEQNFKRIF